MLKTWPSTLPLFELDWSLNPKDNKIENKTDRGPSKSRRRSSISKNEVSGQIEYSELQLSTFQDFYYNQINEGNDSFYINDFISDKIQVAKFISWKANKSGINSYKLSITIEVEYR